MASNILKIEFFDQYKNAKRITKDLLNKEFGRDFKNLSKKQQDDLIDDVSEFLVGSIISLQENINYKSRQIDEMIIFIFGIMIGISGGLISNIIHEYLSKLGLVYSLASVILFIISLYLVIQLYMIKDDKKPDLSSRGGLRKYIKEKLSQTNE